MALSARPHPSPEQVSSQKAVIVPVVWLDDALLDCEAMADCEATGALACAEVTKPELATTLDPTAGTEADAEADGPPGT